jgi:hypothetical protein
MESIVIIDSNAKLHFFNGSTCFVCALPDEGVLERTKLVYETSKGAEVCVFIDGSPADIWQQIKTQVKAKNPSNE